MIQGRISKMLNVKYPIIQGGMAWIADASLAAAVSNGGGLGIIAGMNGDIEWLRAEIRKTKTLTDKPFGVNVMLMSPNASDVASLVIEEGVSVVTTGAGNPERFMDNWLSNSVKVIPVVPSKALAKRAARCGASAVIAEGGESGGHIGDLTTMTLVPQVVDVCSEYDVPVIAAGGIGDGRGIAAALMLGASGVQVGTRFLVANECNVHQIYKKKILRAKDIDTMVTGKRLGHPVRSLKTPLAREYFEKEYDSSVTNEELEQYGAGALRLAALFGDEQKGCFMAGQSAALVTKEQPAAEIIEEMFREAENIIRGANKWLK